MNVRFGFSLEDSKAQTQSPPDTRAPVLQQLQQNIFKTFNNTCIHK